jgi:hypothetical protein
LLSILAGEDGVPATVAAAARAAGIDVKADAEVVAQNVAPELLERSTGARYPSIHVYCAGLKNLLKEKFRKFSGKAQMVAEVRVSQDRLEGLEAAVAVYANAVTEVLDGNRGEWGEGMFFGGSYEVTISPVKHGGRNYLQTAKVSFELEVSR